MTETDTNETGVQGDGQVNERSDLQVRVDAVVDRDLPLLKGTLRALLDTDIDSIDELPDAGRSFHQRIGRLEQRLEELERRLEAIEAVAGEQTTKEQKFAAVLAFAENKQQQTDKVAVSAGEVKGCTGVSRRYAYDLMDAMAETVDGISLREPKQITTGNGSERKTKALLVDCEQVRTDDGSVNKFTTGVDTSDGE